MEIGSGSTCFSGDCRMPYVFGNLNIVVEDLYYLPFCDEARAYPLVSAYEKITISDCQKRVIIIGQFRSCHDTGDN